MKKTFLLSLALVFLICTTLTGFAAPVGAPVPEVTDAANDTVSVTGKISAKEYVTLMVLNPGKDEDDVNFANDMAEVVQYIGSYWAEEKQGDDFKYRFDVPMHGDAGGVFTFIITAGGEKYDDEIVTLEYYFSHEKAGVIGDINTKAEAIADAEDGDASQEELNALLSDLADSLTGVNDGDVRYNGAYTLYSLDNNDLYKFGEVDEIAKVIKNTVDEDGAFSGDDVNAFSDALRVSALIAAYNTGKTDLLVTDGVLDYTTVESMTLVNESGKYDALDLEDTDAYDDYINMLSADGRANVNAALIDPAEDYATVDDIAEAFTKLIAYYGIVNNNEAGYGHVDHYFETYAEVYEEAGFDLDDLNDKTKNKVYKELLKKDTNDLDDLKDEFNDLVPWKSGSSDDDGGSSSTGFSPAPVTPSTGTNYITPTSFFLDIDTVPWAEEAIIALADKGIINGKGNNNFAPNDYVTRAEYLKMLMGALELVDGSTHIPFGDIADDHWAREFIAAAVNGGIANGMTDTEFAPNGMVTREQSATFAARAMEKKGVVLEADTNTFADDAAVSDWAKTAVNSLKKAGILSGSGDNMVNPKNNLTRAEAAKIIYGIMTNMGLLETAAE